MAELWHGVADYFREVFILQLDWWIALGFLAQALFSARFLVRWIASERAGRSVIPLAFWLFSVGGGTLLLVYALHRKDPVFIAGQALGLLIFARSLDFIHRGRRHAAVAAQ